jgi:hypothetical protein
MSTGELLYDVYERWLVVYVEALPQNLFNCIVGTNDLLDEVTLVFRKILCWIHVLTQVVRRDQKNRQMPRSTLTYGHCTPTRAAKILDRRVL